MTIAIETYTALDGRVVDLGLLDDASKAFLERCIRSFKRGLLSSSFIRLAYGSDNPGLQESKGRITQAVWDSLLYQVLRDMEDRLAIALNEVEPEPGDLIDIDPFADDWVPASKAADEKGVARPTIHKAIERGALIGRTIKRGGRNIEVSRRSLDLWSPNVIRQAAKLGSRVG